MKLVEGKNRIRILSDAIDGYVYWLDENGNVVSRKEKAPKGSKPARARTLQDCASRNPGAQNEAKQFVACVVWNYAGEAMQILELTQATVIEAIQGYAYSSDWGDPTFYDIEIEKTGQGLDTEYTVRAMPPKPFTQDITGLNKINLEALFDGGDPFLGKAENVTLAEMEGDGKNAPITEPTSGTPF